MGLTIYSTSDFWLNGPALIMIKLGVILMLMAFSYVWNLQFAAERFSWVRQFGATSLLVYWVHIELVYGKTLWFFKESLTIPRTALMAVLVIGLMLGLSLLRTNWPAVKTFFGSRNAELTGAQGD